MNKQTPQHPGFPYRFGDRVTFTRNDDAPRECGVVVRTTGGDVEILCMDGTHVILPNDQELTRERTNPGLWDKVRDEAEDNL